METDRLLEGNSESGGREMAGERRRHPRVSVNLNAVLINKGGMPRGCRVRNLSEEGMLLERGTGGDMGSLHEGDTVEVHISLRRGSDKRRSVPVSAVVRRVDERSIGVEFLDNNEELAPVIDFYRETVAREFGSSTLYDEDRNRNARELRYRLSAWALALLVLALCLLVGGYIYSYRISDRLSILETTVSEQAGALTRMFADVVTGSKSEEMLIDLDTHVQGLASTVAELEEKLAVALHQPEGAPDRVEPAVVVPSEIISRAPETTLGVNGGNERSPDVPVEAPADAAEEGLASAGAPASGAGGSGPWTINLVSLRDKAAADQFATRARSKGIPVEQNPVDVKGTQFWRVQITGFSSSSDARSYAGTAKKALGIKEVWLIKR